ncbi:MAG TPA: nitroreductase family deazaflavin-dependent oxidoreductase [Candidatus Dormibacteraeota bacterium]|jgi:deazaflavin-dependent oxidoreductase (nitroreductase family)|nr:nitroreductase family deazaflavin-dependent oxidoreductase [Candidatus Dormibacteraeota bacterium]
MSDIDDFTARVIAEFRANHGRVGPPFEGSPLLLLHSVGAKSGESRINPMMYLKEGDHYAVFASKGGADTNPGWYHNLKANPQARIEVGDDTLDVDAVEATGAERDAIYGRQAALYPVFAQYEQGTERTIPVFVLTPRS